MTKPTTAFSVTHTHGTSYYGKVYHGEMQLTIQEALDDTADNFNYTYLNFKTREEWTQFVDAVHRIDDALYVDLTTNEEEPI